MNLLQLLAAVRKTVTAIDAAGGASAELGLLGRALGNALGSTGFPVGRAYAVYAKHGLGDPLALLQALRAEQDVRAWVASWSGVLGTVGPPGGASVKPPKKKRA